MSRKTPSLGGRRRAARVSAVQALYQMDLSGGAPEDVIAEFVAYRLRGEDAGTAKEPDADIDLFTDLVGGVIARRDDIDRTIGEALDKERKIDRLEILMRSILRAGAYELMARDDIDAALTISEYVAVADAFFNEREPALVNAVLDRIARNIAGAGPSADPAHGIAQDG
jgi:N utilization substance protein B